MFVVVAFMHGMHPFSSFSKNFFSRNLSKGIANISKNHGFLKEKAKKYSVINLNLGALRKLTPSVDDPLMGYLVVDAVPLSSSKEGPKLAVLAKKHSKLHTKINPSAWKRINPIKEKSFVLKSYKDKHLETSKKSFATLVVLFEVCPLDVELYFWSMYLD